MKYPHLATWYLVFNLQNKLHRHKEFFIRDSAATLIKKEKTKRLKMSTGKGVGESEVSYIGTYADIYNRLSF